MRVVAIFLLIALAFPSYGQSDEDDHHSGVYKSFLRVGGGIHRNGYAELGFTRMQLVLHDRMPIIPTVDCYFAGELAQLNRASNNSVYGLKIGAEASCGPAVGLEVTYLFDKLTHDVRITPRIGISVLGTINLYYGYHIFVLDQLNTTGHHQLSLILNLRPAMVEGGIFGVVEEY